MASSDTWSEFEALRQSIRHNTVDRLKQILQGLNDQCRVVLFKSGKKQELIDRVVAQLDQWRQSNNVEKWIRAKAVLQLVSSYGLYSPNKMPSNLSPAAPHTSYASGSSNGIPSYSSAQGSTAILHNPYGSPGKFSASVPVVASSSASAKLGTIVPTFAVPSSHHGAFVGTGIRFRPSPFLRVDQIVSSIVECPESSSPSDRRQQHVTFTLTHDHVAKLKSTSSKYQLRLYCTSSSFYSSGPNAFRTNTGPCPIEFPPTCEVRVNSLQITANLKGLKKRPGTAPPADLGKAVRLTTSWANRVEMVYVNSQQPSTPKKYYLAVALVEVTSVEFLVERLRNTKHWTVQDVLAKLVQTQDEDDDIIAGPQKMSLKCPLSFVRIETPCRSSKCVHPQCFDATSWFSVMEQTTTFLCPVCEKVLDHDDLIMDGYFNSILRETPDSVEDIMVEADGEWHTTDNQYGSLRWRLSHPTVPASGISPPRKAPTSQKSRHYTPAYSDDDQAKSGDEIVILDSDDEDEGRVKRELSPSCATRSPENRSYSIIPPPRPSGSDAVIDLTLDSDDDGPPPTQVQTQTFTPNQTHTRTFSQAQPSSSRAVDKRKASDESSTYVVTKKSRADDNDGVMRAMAMRTLSMAVNNPGSSSSNPSGASRDHASHHVPRSPNASPPQPRYPGSGQQASRYSSRYSSPPNPFRVDFPRLRTPPRGPTRAGDGSLPMAYTGSRWS